MGAEFSNLTWEQLCDMMCGGPEDEIAEEKVYNDRDDRRDCKIEKMKGGETDNGCIQMVVGNNQRK